MTGINVHTTSLINSFTAGCITIRFDQDELTEVTAMVHNFLRGTMPENFSEMLQDFHGTVEFSSLPQNSTNLA